MGRTRGKTQGGKHKGGSTSRVGSTAWEAQELKHKLGSTRVPACATAGPGSPDHVIAAPPVLFALGQGCPRSDAAPAAGTELSQDSLGSSPARAQVSVPTLRRLEWGEGAEGISRAVQLQLCCPARCDALGRPVPHRGSLFCRGVPAGPPTESQGKFLRCSQV